MKPTHYLHVFFLTCFMALCCCSACLSQPVLQTQFGPDGMEVDLIRAKASGKVLSVVLAFRNSGNKSASVRYPVADVHFIDNTDSKKYQVLKDEKGAWLTGPTSFVKQFIANQWQKIAVTSVSVDSGGKKIVWYKFPLPPNNVKTIQINLPGVSPFDDVEIQR